MTEHSEFKKGAVHTNFIPDHYSELFRGKKWTEDVVIFSVFGQIFNEFAFNSKSIGNKDPFVSESCFRLNHNLTRTLNYKLDKNVDLNVNVTFISKNNLRIKYLIEDKDKNTKIEDDLTVGGNYEEKDGYLSIECRIKDRVS